MKPPAITEAMTSSLDSADSADSSSIDQYSAVALDLGELVDDARDCIMNGRVDDIDHLVEILRIDHVRNNRSFDEWLRLRPLAQAAAKQAFTEAVANGASLAPSLAQSWPTPRALAVDEILAARATPDCIVEGYLFADVAVIPAPGGFGKTTLMLFEAACIAYGSPTLYGRQVQKPGPVVIITAEDSREQMAARLREVISANGLASRLAKISRNIYINDVAGLGLKLTAVENDVVTTAPYIDDLIDALRAIRPVLVIIDPAVSFGIGESRVNDAEQGLIEAARRLRNEIGCCVRYVHHTGKQNARENAVDQYAGRGGSALPDGARMVHVLGRLSNADWFKATGAELLDGETGLRIVSAKSSYCVSPPDILLRRSGFKFEVVKPAVQSDDAITDLIFARIVEDFRIGVLRSLKSLEEDKTLGPFSRAQRRGAVDQLLKGGKLEKRRPPNGKGAATYLHPLSAPEAPSNS